MSIAFLSATLLVVVTPGPGVLYTLSAALAHGRRAGLVAALGCTVATVPHVVVALAGLAALVHAGGPAFTAVRYLGAGYLLYLGRAMLRERSENTGPVDAAPPTAARLVGTAVLVNLLNPKPVLFLVAFLPQFVPADAPGAAGRMLALAAMFTLVTLVVFGGYAIGAAAVRDRVLARPRAADRLRQGFAVSFLVLGVSLALSTP
ncbi:LysE family translocator [Micromonospora siamensis]|uniref:Threonine/homoserine/homoserine lactone efflux protein n=1 Tax=Micromonospora siamensis TaxID=299152 RepID=A0A1C5IKY2_9ACTN|nr:LysE family translocator [Micromonospora siamensis]SCG58944.1 Threonine/homoserine/homoserine lactone efflux protein [Micromonospora siamensis]